VRIIYFAALFEIWIVHHHHHHHRRRRRHHLARFMRWTFRVRLLNSAALYYLCDAVVFIVLSACLRIERQLRAAFSRFQVSTKCA